MSKSAVAFAREDNTNPVPIVMRSIGTLYLASEAPKGANLIVRDSGRGSPLTDTELKASIYAKGIIHPLIWKSHQGKDYVVAGNRRLRLLREIFADALASSVQTQNVDDFGGDWREIAIDTNLALPAHLVERYEVIVALAKELKLSEADVCARYGMSDQQYRRVMALGKMAECVRQAWKDGAIDAKTAQTFTLEPDPKEQERIFVLLSKGGAVTHWEVKRRIVPATQQELGRLVQFVGLEQVRRAKLLKQEDFFADEKTAAHIVTDPKALNKLVGDKLAAKCEELVAAGWKWAIPENKLEGQLWQYATIDAKKTAPTAPEKKRMDEIQALLDGDDLRSDDEDLLIEELDRLEQAVALRGFTPEQMKKGGCILKIGINGVLTVEYGRIKPAEKKQVQASERPKAKPKPKKPGVVTLTNALAERLSLQLEEALSTAITVTPHVAVAAMVAGFSSAGHVVDVNIGTATPGARYGISGTANEKNFLQVFEGALKATPEARVVMLTSIVSEALSIQIRSAEAKAPIESKALQALVAAMRPDAVNRAIAEGFDAKGYFEGVALDACVAAVRCSMGDDHASKVARMKKGEAAKFAAANVPEKGWLPKELRTCHYKGPTEKAAPATAAKKKATAKKPASLLSKKQQKAVKAQGVRAGKAAMAKK